MNVKITDFADYTDIVSFCRKAETFLSTEEFHACLAVGDNGIGASGHVTATDVTPMVALPSADIKAKWGSTSAGWGKKVKVTINGMERIGEVQDIAPAGVCDLNPAMLKSFGFKHPFSGQGSWEWVD